MAVIKRRAQVWQTASGGLCMAVLLHMQHGLGRPACDSPLPCASTTQTHS
jgi:hypothetical protein